LPRLREGEARAAGFPADNARFTKRFAFYVGRRRRQASIRDVANELKLDHSGERVTNEHRWARLPACDHLGPHTIVLAEKLMTPPASTG
jgi:hypothetical protein